MNILKLEGANGFFTKWLQNHLRYDSHKIGSHQNHHGNVELESSQLYPEPNQFSPNSTVEAQSSSLFCKTLLGFCIYESVL